MADVNKVILIGHIEGSTTISDEDKYGYTDMRFTLVTRSFFTSRKTGERQPAEVRHKILYHTKTSKLAPYLTDNRVLFIEGFIKPTGEDTFVVSAYNIQLLGTITNAPKAGVVAPPENYEIPDDDLPY